MTVEYRQDDIEGYYAYCYFLYEVLKRQMGGTMNKYERERKKERDRDREKRRTELEISPHCGVQKVAKRKKLEFTLRHHCRMFAFATSSK